MAQLASDPSLAQTSVEATDLVVCLRPVTNAQGILTGYCAYNITAQDFAESIVTMGLLTLGPTLPSMAPEGGGLYLNVGAFSFEAMTGTLSGTGLTPAAMQQSFQVWFDGLPTTDPGDGVSIWNNNGIATQSAKATS